MKHICKISIILSIITLLQSCYSESNEYIDRNTWFLYSEEDTLLFNSNSSIDTFIIKDIDSFMGSFSTGINQEILFIRYKYLGDTNSYYRINRYPKIVNVFWKNGINGGINYSMDQHFTYAIGYHLFDSVYNPEPGYKPDNYIEQTIYYTDRYGIIAYQKEDGELFELDLNYLP